MPTNITTIYDAMLTRLGALFPTGQRLVNPYRIGENPDLLMLNGYGIAIGSGSSPRRLCANQVAIQRTFRIINTRKYEALETDATAKASSEKSLMEDQVLVLKDFEKETTINGTAILTNYESDGGIQYAFGDTNRYIYIESVFRVDYFETY